MTLPGFVAALGLVLLAGFQTLNRPPAA